MKDVVSELPLFGVTVSGALLYLGENVTSEGVLPGETRVPDGLLPSGLNVVLSPPVFGALGVIGLSGRAL